MDWRIPLVGVIIFIPQSIFAGDEPISLPPTTKLTLIKAVEDAPPQPLTLDDLESPAPQAAPEAPRHSVLPTSCFKPLEIDPAEPKAVDDVKPSAPPDQPETPQQPELPPSPLFNPLENEPVWLQGFVPDRFLPWLSVQYATSPEITEQQTGYTSFEAFVPFAQWNSGANRGLLFLDGDGFLNNYGRWGSNLGLGGRWYNCSTNRIFGVNGYWDNNDTSFGTYNRVGFGVETLGRYVDFRLNGYAAVGDSQKVFGVTYTNPFFQNHFIMFNQTTYTATAMNGFDSELGGWVPYLGQHGLRAYAGLYGYAAGGAQGAIGGHLRVEERLTDDVNLNLTLDSDRTFGTTVAFSAGFRFGGGLRRRGSSRGFVPSRLVDPVERNDNIVVEDPVSTAVVPATKPGTNIPIYVDHFASYASAGGNGTFEHPFNALQNPTSPQQADILYVWANSNFSRQNITLLNNQRLLGEGLTYSFTASQGTFILPRATNFPNLPIIAGAPGNAVTLANNDEVAGLVITGANQNGIFGDAVTGFYIHDNNITGSGLNGIVLTNVNGAGTIAGNNVSNNGDVTTLSTASSVFGEGIYLQGTSFTGNIVNNTANNNGDVATFLQNTGTTTFGQGIAVNVGTVTGNISNNQANGNGAIGLLSGASVNSFATLTFGQGIAVNATAFNGNISGNTTNGNGTVNPTGGIGVLGFRQLSFGQGISVNATTFNGNVSGNTANGNGSFAAIPAGQTGLLNFGAVAFGQGISIGGTSFNGSITGNTTNNNGAFGNIDGPGSQAISSPGSMIFGQGILVSSFNSFSGNISGNTANGNGAMGNLSNNAGGVGTGSETLFGQGITVYNVGTFTGNISNNTTDGNGSIGSLTNNCQAVSNNGANTAYGQGILVDNVTTFNGNVSGNTANNNGDLGNSNGSVTGVGNDPTLTFGQGIAFVNTTTVNGSITGNTANDNGTFGNWSNSPNAYVNNLVGTATFGQGILVMNTTSFNGNISSNTADGNGTFGDISSGIGVNNQGNAFFGQGIAVIGSGTSFSGNINGNTATGNGSIGQVSNSATGVVATNTTIFGQGLLVQATNFSGSIDQNTFTGNGKLTFVAQTPTVQGTNVGPPTGTTLYSQGILLQGFGSGSFQALVDNNTFGGNYGTQNTTNNSAALGTDLLAIYTGSGKMGIELSGNTTTNVFSIPPLFNYDLQNQGAGTFHLLNNQGTTGGTGSVGTSTPSAPTAGPVPF